MSNSTRTATATADLSTGTGSSTAATASSPSSSANRNEPTYCARHPKVETALKCSRCLTPICPSCAISGAVGMLCPSCGTGTNNALYDVPPPKLAFAVLAGVAAGTLAGFLLQAISNYFIWGILFLSPVIGGFLGEVVLRTTGRKRGRTVEIVTAASVVVGAALSLLLSNRWWIVFSPMDLALFVLTVGITAASAVGKIRSL